MRAQGNPNARNRSGHFVPLREDDPYFSAAYMYCVAWKLLLPPNCLVLWNSKTLHGTSPGSRERPNTAEGAPKLNSLTCFPSMMPKALRSTTVLKAKQELYCKGGTTSHWATHADAHPLNIVGALKGRLDK